MFVASIAARVLEIVVAGGGHDGFRIHDEMGKRNHASINEFLIDGMVEGFDGGGVRVGQELIELGSIGQVAHVEATHLGKYGVSVEKLD